MTTLSQDHTSENVLEYLLSRECVWFKIRFTNILQKNQNRRAQLTVRLCFGKNVQNVKHQLTVNKIHMTMSHNLAVQ